MIENGSYKCIYEPYIAKYLLRKNCRIVDIKPDRNNKDKTIFIFIMDKAYENAMELLNTNHFKQEKKGDKNDFNGDNQGSY